MIELKTTQEVEEMVPAGRFVGEVLTKARESSHVGTNLLDIDELVHRMIDERGAVSSYVDYHPSFGASAFGHYICTSVNDAVLHGLPHDYRLRDGDLVTLDFACSVDGWVGDSAISYIVGTPRPEDERLIEATEVALREAIAQAHPGNRIGDLEHAIGEVGRRYGYSANLEFGGHGVGRTMHGDPHVANDGRAGHGYPLRPGLVIAIEPWFLATTNEIYRDRDGWTLRSVDGSRGAHSEHTVAITEDGPRVLTTRD